MAQSLEFGQSLARQPVPVNVPVRSHMAQESLAFTRGHSLPQLRSKIAQVVHDLAPIAPTAHHVVGNFANGTKQ